jgi:hypothetical protein
MTQVTRAPLRSHAMRPLALAITVAAMVTAAPALAQQPTQPTDARAPDRIDPWRSPEAPAGKPRSATSDLSATDPTPAEQREARKLATAIFAAPSAGQRAADKAAPPSAAAVPPAQPKAEWLEDKVGPGGDGLQVKTPF